MNPSLPVLDTLRVASPCDASWEEMAGDDRHRFCDHCEKHVYNLPMLGPEELVDLIETTEGSFCGRLYSRKDGTVLTSDCPVGMAAKVAKARRKRALGAAAAAAALALTVGGALFGASWGGADVDPVMLAGEIEVAPPPQVQEEKEPPRPILMGKIAPVHRQ